MNVALTIALALETAGVGTLGGTIQLGKYDPDDIPETGLWSVVQEPGTPAGGNFATWKERIPVSVRLLLPSHKANDMYTADPTVKAAVLSIPEDNALIPSITCSSVGDYEADVAEARVGVWNVEVVTITDGRTN